MLTTQRLVTLLLDAAVTLRRGGKDLFELLRTLEPRVAFTARSAGFQTRKNHLVKVMSLYTPAIDKWDRGDIRICLEWIKAVTRICWRAVVS